MLAAFAASRALNFRRARDLETAHEIVRRRDLRRNRQSKISSRNRRRFAGATIRRSRASVWAIIAGADMNPRVVLVGWLCAFGVVACSNAEKKETTGGAGSGGTRAGRGGSSAGDGGAGTAGVTGTAGTAGIMGAAGTTGVAGTSDAAGAGGSTGSAGTTGSAGSAGTTGAGGAAGTTGAPREDAMPRLLRVRQEHGVGALRGLVYVVAGYAMNPSTSVDVYDPTTQQWRAVASVAAPMQHPNVGVVHDRLFVAGYYEGQGTGSPRGNVYAYDPDRDRWDAVSPLPIGNERAAGCVAVMNDKLYLFGGARGAGNTVADANVYDPVADAWQKLPDMPVRKEHCAAGAIGGKITIAGGRTDGIEGFEPTTLVFDPANPGYTQKKAIPTPRGGCASAVVGDKLYLFGGEGDASNAAGVFPNVDAYDPATDAWRALPDLALPRHGFGAAVVDGRVYLPGGASREGGGAVDMGSIYTVQ
jgi:N-acetylneuraminic acid mutarotase